MEEYKGYKPSQEEIEEAESMMKWWQARGSKLREEAYGQLNEQERATWREMQMKGEMYMHTMQDAGFPDKSPDEFLRDIRAGVVQKSKDGRTVGEVLEQAKAEFEKRFPEGSL